MTLAVRLIKEIYRAMHLCLLLKTSEDHEKRSSLRITDNYLNTFIRVR